MKMVSLCDAIFCVGVLRRRSARRDDEDGRRQGVWGNVAVRPHCLLLASATLPFFRAGGKGKTSGQWP